MSLKKNLISKLPKSNLQDSSEAYSLEGITNNFSANFVSLISNALTNESTPIDDSTDWDNLLINSYSQVNSWNGKNAPKLTGDGIAFTVGNPKATVFQIAFSDTKIAIRAVGKPWSMISGSGSNSFGMQKLTVNDLNKVSKPGIYYGFNRYKGLNSADQTVLSFQKAPSTQPGEFVLITLPSASFSDTNQPPITSPQIYLNIDSQMIYFRASNQLDNWQKLATDGDMATYQNTVKSIIQDQNNVNTQLSSASNGIQTANTNAQLAQTKANTANISATSALNKANTADQDASNANDNATQAKASAQSAQNTANQASNGVSSLNTSVSNLSGSVNNSLNTVNNSVSTISGSVTALNNTINTNTNSLNTSLSNVSNDVSSNSKNLTELSGKVLQDLGEIPDPNLNNDTKAGIYTISKGENLSSNPSLPQVAVSYNGKLKVAHMDNNNLLQILYVTEGNPNEDSNTVIMYRVEAMSAGSMTWLPWNIVPHESEVQDLAKTVNNGLKNLQDDITGANQKAAQAGQTASNAVTSNQLNEAINVAETQASNSNATTYNFASGNINTLNAKLSATVNGQLKSDTSAIFSGGSNSIATNASNIATLSGKVTSLGSNNSGLTSLSSSVNTSYNKLAGSTTQNTELIDANKQAISNIKSEATTSGGNNTTEVNDFALADFNQAEADLQSLEDSLATKGI